MKPEEFLEECYTCKNIKHSTCPLSQCTKGHGSIMCSACASLKGGFPELQKNFNACTDYIKQIDP